MERKNKATVLLKVFLVFGAVVIICAALVIGYIVYHLPSAHMLSTAILNPSKISGLAMVNDTVQSKQEIPEAPPVNNPYAPPPPNQPTTTVTQTQTLNSRAGLEDLINLDRPLSNFCGSLKNAKSLAQTKGMNRQETNQAFKLSLDPATADPRAQMFKPLFRYIFRLPAMRSLVDDLQASLTQPNEDLLAKAEFYSKVAAAFVEMRDHKEDYEAISDRSYLFYKLNEAVALKPEILNDARLQKFCEDTENAFNSNEPVQFEQEKKNFERLLAELDVDPQSIKYNPNYKTQFDVNMGDRSLQISGGWLEEALRRE